MQMQQQQEHAFEFTGSGWEYFKIWIVNLLLSILTLGIYSAWAKVRRLQYFYRNTRLADASFDYHGMPKAILKGRIIAFVMLMVYSGAMKLSPALGITIALMIAVVMPWLIVRSLRFKLYNSSYRGLRFSFAGSDGGAYTVFLLFPILTALTLYLLMPFTHQRIKQYQHCNSQFGDTFFNFDAPVKSFYGVYLKVLGMGLGLGFLAGLFSAVGLTFLLLLLPVVFLFVMAYMAVSLPNLIWNSTTLGEHTIQSKLEVGPYLWISFTNLLGIVLTLGLYIPFATVRMLRYKLEHMSLMAQGDLNEFVAGQEQAISATGEETAEMFDVDISL
ncbi:MAG: YjgN family protein [Sideroxydans sp.]|nr:YjgN family protein [Sideroxydans sp.]